MCRRFRVARGPKSAFKDNGENFAIRALTSCSSRNLIEPGVDPFLKRFAKPTSNDPTLIDCLDEESDAEVTERCQKVLRFVEQRPERRIALVSHGMFLKAFIELIRPNAPEGTPREQAQFAVWPTARTYAFPFRLHVLLEDTPCSVLYFSSATAEIDLLSRRRL